MQSSMPTETEKNRLASTLEEIEELDEHICAAEYKVSELKKRRERLAEIAVEEMTESRLVSGLRVGGRSWRIQWEHSMSIAADKADEVIKAARACGKGDALVSVNTSRLKSVLAEMAKAENRDPTKPWAEGTPFAGLVSEYVRPVLRHLTVER